ncbi:cell division cycle protein 37, partial [Lecanoromycetidae sp. Uapishka_2]
MVVNYSKWDALELSDDSDIEVHPNVDKRSFIRAKQNQIHQHRFERKHQIKTLKYERIINDGMLERIDTLLASLHKHASQATGGNPDEFMMQALMECSGDPAKDRCPDPPEGVHYKEEQPGTYSQMMAGLVDQVKKEIGSEPKDWYSSYVKGVEGHKTKVQGLQRDLLKKLSELEKEESSKITSESIHEGFSQSSVSKEKEKPKEPTKTIEVLNPGSLKKDPLRRLDSGGQTSGADADVDEPGSNEKDETDIEPTALGKQFAKIKTGDYRECLRFISEYHEVVKERETDGLLMEAFNAQMEGKGTYARQCVHQALLLQYCRSLGKDGVGLFFKRITSPGHNAQKVFLDDVNTTYARIKTRTAEIAKERAANPQEREVEQIQLHAVEPGTEIHINVPQPDSNDDTEQQARIIFERFPPGLQRALESGSLDRVNEVLGKMSVSEAEEVVEQLGEGGMLSLEQGVIDGTTEEGQGKLRELEREAREGKQSEGDESREEKTDEAEVRLRELEVETKGINGKGPAEVDAADLD